MKLSITIPFYNEEKTIREVIRRIKNLHLKIKKEIIVIDDGSTDSGYEKIKNIRGIKLLKHKKNKGKGAAVKTALSEATGDIFLVQDADLELAPEEIPKIIAPLIDNNAEVVYGSRNLYGRNKEHSFIFYWGGKFVTFLTNLLYKTQLTDEACGYKAFKKNILKDININEDRFEWEPEITAKISKKGIKIHEVSVSYNPRMKRQGKKLGWKDGFKAIWTLLKYRFKN